MARVLKLTSHKQISLQILMFLLLTVTLKIAQIVPYYPTKKVISFWVFDFICKKIASDLFLKMFVIQAMKLRFIPY